MPTKKSLLATTLFAAALAVTAGAGPAAAEPAVAAAAPAVLYTTLVQADNTTTTTVGAVRYDATGRRIITTAGNDLDLGPAARYSPDRTRVAWRQTDFSTATPTYSVVVANVATKAQTPFPLPAAYTFQPGLVFPTWTADGTHLVVTALDSSDDAVITRLDLATGTYTPVYTVPGGASPTSLDVSPDGSIAFTTTSGVTVLPGGTTPARSLYTVGTDEGCYKVRARPSVQREFTYRCDTYGQDSATQVIRSGTPSGTQRVVYTGDTTPSNDPVKYLDDYAWAPSGATLALRMTTVDTVNATTCLQSMTDTLETINARGSGRTVVQTEPTITAKACRGFGYGDVNSVVWSPDGQTVVFLHATKFLGPQFAYAVKPSAPGTQVTLARQVVDLDS